LQECRRANLSRSGFDHEIASTYTLRDLENLIGVATDAYEWIYVQGVEPVLPSAEQGPVVTA
jgi:hypothetical protein